MSANTNTRMEDAIADTVQMIANLGQQQQEAMHRHQEADQRFEVFLAEARADRQRADRDRALNESEHRAFRETFQTMLAEIDRLWQRVAG
jgi:maltose O-acetyltransferase